MSRDNYAGQIRQKGSHIASDIAGIGAILKDATSDKLHAIKDAASEKLIAMKDGAASAGRNTRHAVNEVVTSSPWRSMLVAAAAGLLFGLFLRRK